jgi:hypothetical protein
MASGSTSIPTQSVSRYERRSIDSVADAAEHQKLRPLTGELL